MLFDPFFLVIGIFLGIIISNYWFKNNEYKKINHYDTLDYFFHYLLKTDISPNLKEVLELFHIRIKEPGLRRLIVSGYKMYLERNFVNEKNAKKWCNKYINFQYKLMNYLFPKGGPILIEKDFSSFPSIIIFCYYLLSSELEKSSEDNISQLFKNVISKIIPQISQIEK